MEKFYIVHSYPRERRDFNDLESAENYAAARRSYFAGREHAETVRVTTHNTPIAPDVIGYTDEQSQAIKLAIAGYLKDEIVTGGFIECSWSDQIVDRSQQKFAVFDKWAYELFRDEVLSDSHREFHYLPVIVDGRMFRIDPEEGRGGLLYLTRCTKRNGAEYNGNWHCITISTGYIYTEELTMTNQQIMDNIADEIDAGATHLTGGTWMAMK
ncbi:MAG: hypothetical protein LV471_09215 [Nitrosomonas sp.]|nr:hypothetical protein [Nitrosomonas sp.]